MSAMLISKYGQHKLDTRREREKSHSFSFYFPQHIRTGGGSKWCFEERLKCSLEKSWTSHIFLSPTGHSAVFPRTGRFLKGTWKFSIIAPAFSISKVLLVTPKHRILYFPVLSAIDSFSFFNLSRMSPNLYFWNQALVYLEKWSAPWRWTGFGKAYFLSQKKAGRRWKVCFCGSGWGKEGQGDGDGREEASWNHWE